MVQSERDITIITTDLARRMNTYTLWRMVSVSMLWGVGVALVLAVVSKFVAIPVPLILTVASILVVSLLWGVIRGSLARVSALEAAIAADAQLDLKERLSSAVELLRQENRREMAQLQLADAADCARSVDPKSVCPRVFPMTAKVLPLALLALVVLTYFPSLYGLAEVPAEVRQAIRQAGAEMETAAGEALISDEAARLASEMQATGREMQDKPLTKKEALRELSNLSREMEALKTMGEISEKLGEDMTPERKRMLEELLRNLAENLRDLQGMEEISQKVLKVQQANLSAESLKELADLLEQMGITTSDMEALRRMLKQVAKSKRDVGESEARMFHTPEVAGGSKPTDLQAEEESGLMGSGAPGKKAARDMKEEIELASHRQLPSDQGYDSELEGQLSPEGRSLPAGIEPDPGSGESVVPYEELYLKYRDAADDAIARTAIPWMHREHVKSYFDAIKPKGNN